MRTGFAGAGFKGGTFMLHNTFCRRLAALVLTLAVAVSAVLPVFAVYPMPIQTATETEAVYLFNADTGKTLLTQNADQPRYVASLTKMMTALLLLESGKDLNGEVTVPTALTQEFRDIQNANGTTMGLRIGETVRRIDLLNAMLIVSANDAASVIAYDVGGSVLDFVKQMNARAQELGCTGTNFTCAHGLFDYGNVSTAQDLAKIAAACAENQTFAQVAGTASYVLPATNLRKAERTISSSNSLMNSESANYREYVRWVQSVATTYLIFDDSNFKHWLNALRAYREMHLISQESVRVLRDELFAMLDEMETVAVKGEFENGNRIFLYLSDIDLESSYSYVTTSRHQAVNIGMFSLNGLRTPDPLMYEYVKKWIKTQSRFSTLISGSGELRRIHYFKRQREIVAQLG